eukprot:EG_transcript_13831
MGEGGVRVSERCGVPNPTSSPATSDGSNTALYGLLGLIALPVIIIGVCCFFIVRWCAERGEEVAYYDYYPQAVAYYPQEVAHYPQEVAHYPRGHHGHHGRHQRPPAGPHHHPPSTPVGYTPVVFTDAAHGHRPTAASPSAGHARAAHASKPSGHSAHL